MVSAGINTSSYLNEDGGWQLGYRLGWTFNFKVSKFVVVSLPFAYVRINAYQQNVEGSYYSHDNYVYRTYKDWHISLSFFEFPILLSYKFYNAERYNLSFSFGPGIKIAIKDYSGQPTYTFTDEIIGTHDGQRFDSIDSGDSYGYFRNSGMNFYTGIQFNLRRFYLDLLYTINPFNIKDLKSLHTLSLIISIDPG